LLASFCLPWKRAKRKLPKKNTFSTHRREKPIGKGFKVQDHDQKDLIHYAFLHLTSGQKEIEKTIEDLKYMQPHA